MSATREPVEVVERLYTAADLASLPSELATGPVLYELDNGRLLTMSPPGFDHGFVEANLTGLLHSAAAGQKGKVSCGEVGLILWRNPDRVVGADVVFIAAESLPATRSPEGYLETIPDLVVEVVSKNDTQAHLERKTGDYMQAGVKQVWIADPRSKTLTIHRPKTEPERHHLGDTVDAGSLIADFKFRVDDVFVE